MCFYALLFLFISVSFWMGSGHDTAAFSPNQPVSVAPQSSLVNKSSSISAKNSLNLNLTSSPPRQGSKIPKLSKVSMNLSSSSGEDLIQKSKIPVKSKENDSKVGKNLSKISNSISREAMEIQEEIKEVKINSTIVSETQGEVTGNFGQPIGKKIITRTMTTSSSKSIDDSIGNLNNEENATGSTMRTIVTKTSWDSSCKSRDDPESWDHAQFSQDTSPGSMAEISYPKNSDSRQELPSDTDSDLSPRPPRRSLSKRRTLGSSSGSDVALHEGAELSPMEDDQGISHKKLKNKNEI